MEQVQTGVGISGIGVAENEASTVVESIVVAVGTTIVDLTVVFVEQ